VSWRTRGAGGERLADPLVDSVSFDGRLAGVSVGCEEMFEVGKSKLQGIDGRSRRIGNQDRAGIGAMDRKKQSVENAMEGKEAQQVECSQMLHWLALAQQGDQEAFAQIHRHYSRSVQMQAMRIVRQNWEAHDLTQEVFLKVFRHLHTLKDLHAFEGWLRRIVLHAGITYLQRSRRHNQQQGDLSEVADGATDRVEEEVRERERKEQLSRSMESLSQVDRQALHEFYFEHRSLQEIANRLQIPLGTIKRRLHVARHRLAKDAHSYFAS
jgi:RNA polymerase sigma-70 factor (ECF subfamily)